MDPNPKSKSQTTNPIQLLQLKLIQHAGPFDEASNRVPENVEMPTLALHW